MRVAVGLLHYPIYDQQRNVVATNITNLDIHDIARAARVYGIERYYIIHPMQEQLMFVSRILEHWRIGDGAKWCTRHQAWLRRLKIGVGSQMLSQPMPESWKECHQSLFENCGKTSPMRQKMNSCFYFLALVLA